MEKINFEWQGKHSSILGKGLQKIQIEYKWQDINQGGSSIQLREGRIGFRVDGKVERKPIVYRWVLIKGSDKQVLYVGQVRDLKQAFSRQYNNFDPNQATRARVVAILYALFDKGHTWRFEILRIHKFKGKKQEEVQNLFREDESRKKLEGMFIQIYAPPLNRD